MSEWKLSGAEIAELIARRSIQATGGIVVPFRVPGEGVTITGQEMRQVFGHENKSTFVVVRRATDAEWGRQVQIIQSFAPRFAWPTTPHVRAWMIEKRAEILL